MKLVTFVVLVCGAILANGAYVPETRIVGGDDAVPGQIPYQASFAIAGTPTCGAIILSERYALTELECVCSKGSDRPWPPQLFTVTVGSVDLYSGGTRIVVEEITVNPNYSELRSGIALLRLAKPLVFSDTIRAIEMSQQSPPMGAVVEVSGWGRIKDTEDNMYRTLQINEATVVGAEQCSRFLGKSDSQVICMEHLRKNGICRGDFGGPAVYQGKLVGMAAYLLGECGSTLPDVFTSIASNYDWIVAHMEP